MHGHSLLVLEVYSPKPSPSRLFNQGVACRAATGMLSSTHHAIVGGFLLDALGGTAIQAAELLSVAAVERFAAPALAWVQQE